MFLKNFSDNDDFKLWDKCLRQVLLDKNIPYLFNALNNADCITGIKCRSCPVGMFWCPSSMDNEYFHLICLFCAASEPVLECKTESACNIIIDLMTKEHPQLVATALNSLVMGSNLMNSLTPPTEFHDSIQLLKSLYDQRPDMLKFGGATDSIVIADIFEDERSQDFPILIVVDTVTMPARFFLHPLGYKLEHSEESEPSSSSSTQESTTNLIRQLKDIANKIMKCGTNLVLGKHLQHLIPPEVYLRKNHNFKTVTTYDTLKSKDRRRQKSSQHKLACNFDIITAPAVEICKIVNTAISRSRVKRTKVEYYEMLGKYLTTAIWLRNLPRSPFEPLIYHILCKDKDR